MSTACNICKWSSWETRNYTAGGQRYAVLVCGNCGHAPLTPGRGEEDPVDHVELPRGIDLATKAQEIATVAHAGQEYGRTKRPYTYHLEIVVRMLKSRYPDDHELHAMGWLHDSVEDGKLTFDTIEREFGKRVWHGVVLVTHPPGMPYPLYVAQTMTDYDSCRVKWADMEHNSRGQTDHPKYGGHLVTLRKAVVAFEAKMRGEEGDT